MKKIFLLAVSLLIFGHSILAQNTEKQIAEIRAEVAGINKNAAKYTKKTQNVDDISLEGTEATYYISGKGLKKVVARIYSEGSNETDEFFYQGEELIFVFVKFNKYDRPLGSGGRTPKVVRTEEQRFYFAGGNLIRLLVGKKELKSGDERYAELKESTVGTSASLVEAYRKSITD